MFKTDKPNSNRLFFPLKINKNNCFIILDNGRWSVGKLGTVQIIGKFDISMNYITVFRSHIHEYGHVQNRHVMFITIEHKKNIGISEFENT